MDHNVIGRFIAELRKEKNLTQAQLAEKLNITDRAVSKWETGKCLPDSSIMLELCDTLGITVNELLNGERMKTVCCEKLADGSPPVLNRRADCASARKRLILILFSSTLLIGITVCCICNIAISRNLSWSLIPIASITFAWIVLCPGVALGRKGIIASLVSISIFTIPYLFLLSRIVHAKQIFSIGAVMALPSIAFLWIIVSVFKRFESARKFAALGTNALISIPFVLIMNVLISKLIAEPALDLWDALAVFALLILAFAFFIGDYIRRKPR